MWPLIKDAQNNPHVQLPYALVPLWSKNEQPQDPLGTKALWCFLQLQLCCQVGNLQGRFVFKV